MTTTVMKYTEPEWSTNWVIGIDVDSTVILPAEEHGTFMDFGLLDRQRLVIPKSLQ